jgi:hypothetical protein
MNPMGGKPPFRQAREGNLAGTLCLFEACDLVAEFVEPAPGEC